MLSNAHLILAPPRSIDLKHHHKAATAAAAMKTQSDHGNNTDIGNLQNERQPRPIFFSDTRRRLLRKRSLSYTGASPVHDVLSFSHAPPSPSRRSMGSSVLRPSLSRPSTDEGPNYDRDHWQQDIALDGGVGASPPSPKLRRKLSRSRPRTSSSGKTKDDLGVVPALPPSAYPATVLARITKAGTSKVYPSPIFHNQSVVSRSSTLISLDAGSSSSLSHSFSRPSFQTLSPSLGTVEVEVPIAPKKTFEDAKPMTVGKDSFVMKNGRLHHPFGEYVAYPRSYDSAALDSDVWNSLALSQMGQVLTYHKFETPPKKVLDIGCGTGSWIIQAAMTWPDTAFTGVDIVPIQPDLSIGETTKTMAERIHWIKADIVDGLPFPDCQFDFVRISRIACGLPEQNWDTFFADVARIMKPHAALELIDEDLYFPGKPRDAPDLAPESSLTYRTAAAHSSSSAAIALAAEAAEAAEAKAAEARLAEMHRQIEVLAAATVGLSALSIPGVASFSMASPSPLTHSKSPKERRRLKDKEREGSEDRDDYINCKNTKHDRHYDHHDHDHDHDRGRTHGKRSQEKDREIKPEDMVVSTMVPAPSNPRDHSILEAIWNDMHESRFINLYPLPLLASFIPSYFEDMRTHAPITFLLPSQKRTPPIPSPPSRSGSGPGQGVGLGLGLSPSQTAKQLEHDTNAVLWDMAFKSSLPPSDHADADADAGTDVDACIDVDADADVPGTPHQQYFSTGDSIGSHPSKPSSPSKPIFLQDSPPLPSIGNPDANTNANTTTTNHTTTTTKKRRKSTSLPNGAPLLSGTDADPNNPHAANLHLRLRISDVNACAESMWEWVAKFQETAPPMSPSVDHSGASEHSIQHTVAELRRSEFDRLLRYFNFDMSDRMALKDDMMSQLGWSMDTPLDAPPEREAYDNALALWKAYLARSNAALISTERSAGPRARPGSGSGGKSTSGRKSAPAPAPTPMPMLKDVDDFGDRMTRTIRVFCAWKGDEGDAPMG